MRLTYISFAVLLFSNEFCFSQSRHYRKSIDKVLDTISNIPEVKERSDYINRQTNGKRHLSFIVHDRPSDTSKYCWVQVAEDNGANYYTHFNFYVNSKNLEIKYIDIENNDTLDLKSWQKSYHHK